MAAECTGTQVARPAAAQARYMMRYNDDDDFTCA